MRDCPQMCMFAYGFSHWQGEETEIWERETWAHLKLKETSQWRGKEHLSVRSMYRKQGFQAKTSKNKPSAHLSLGSGTKQPCVSVGEVAVKAPPVEDQGCLVGMLVVHLQMSRLSTDSTAHLWCERPPSYKCPLYLKVNSGKPMAIQVPHSLWPSPAILPPHTESGDIMF